MIKQRTIEIAKKTLILIVIGVLFFGCEEDFSFNQDFQLKGSEAEIPTLYFYDETKYDPIIYKGTAKVEVDVELKADNNTDAKISGTFHLGYLAFGISYKRDIFSQDFTLKAGETYKYSGTFTFYGEIHDKAFVLVDISTKSNVNLTNSPVKIVKSNVYIIK